MVFPDKYFYDRESEIELVERNLVQMVFTTGKFEDLPITMPQTESIVNNLEVSGVRPEDIDTVISLKRAYEFVIKRQGVFVAKDVLAINNAVRSSHLGAGQIRTEGVQVPLTNDLWVPPIPNEHDALNDIEKISQQGQSATENAIDLNLYLSRWQLFANGNKRTAIVSANALMIDAGAGILAIPENKMHWYGSLLQKYYRSGRDIDIKQWLYDNAVYGTSAHSISRRK
ncbi:Fic family protein [Furfurilactobacillus curtus]|uniref:Fido domain-containing protein n=1 Tax=Furfurilactobacillus curtus TaxID=1746200 RepID=A0ABQ5JPN4_9LACO